MSDCREGHVLGIKEMDFRRWPEDLQLHPHYRYHQISAMDTFLSAQDHPGWHERYLKVLAIRNLDNFGIPLLEQYVLFLDKLLIEEFLPWAAFVPVWVLPLTSLHKIRRLELCEKIFKWAWNFICFSDRIWKLWT